jgi:dihydroorotate dehydrogenase
MLRVVNGEPVNFYKQFLRPFLFQLEPELAHLVTLKTIDYVPSFFWPSVAPSPVDIMGLHFKNPVGLAAGMDKNADHIDAFGRMGFGFIEVGGVTPSPQQGNPKPRVFRLPRAQAIINRLNFNNKGLDYVARRLEARQYQGIVGANICKDDVTPIEEAYKDYCQCLKTLYPLVDYVSINISCPNSPSLAQLQEGDALKKLLTAIKESQAQCQVQYKRYLPIVVKISPDMTTQALQEMADIFVSFEIDGIIATNTTRNREGLEGIAHASEMGGLSGAAIRSRANQVLQDLHRYLDGKIPLIGLGGILSARDAKERFESGASLIQLMTGLVYEGPDLIKECVEAVIKD